MDTSNMLEFLLLIIAVLGAILGPAKLKQLRKQLNETYWRAEKLQEKLVLAREAMDDLEYENIELTASMMEEGDPRLTGPDM